MAYNVPYKRSSEIDAPTFRFIPDFKFIKLLFGFAITRYCVYTLLAVRCLCITLFSVDFTNNHERQQKDNETCNVFFIVTFLII